MALDLFAGIPVADYAAALPWYEQFFGAALFLAERHRGGIGGGRAPIHLPR